MRGSECRLLEYMEGTKKRFIIPVYQRNYTWKTENCKQLFDDLVKVVLDNRRSHFLGSIVSVYNPSGRYTEFLVIDGQQRLTTVSLLLLAMYNLLSKGLVTSESDTLSKEIYEDYLVDKHQPQETRIKLKPFKNDQAAFSSLFFEDESHQAGNLTANYQYFCDRILQQQITVDQLFDALCCLEIINIVLTQDDNPQLIFESLNSTGMALSEGDKIRNYILMGLPAQKQEYCYDHYWNRIEEYTGSAVSTFIRDYLSVKQQVIPNKERVYFAFKEYIEDNHIETDDLLADMRDYAALYQILLTGKTEIRRVRDCILRLNRLETTVTRPYFLEVLRMQKEGWLSADDMTEIFSIAESYIFRRVICELPTNALNKIFLTLHKDVLRLDGDGSYLEKMKYALLSKRERARFPRDDEFAEEFVIRPVYQMNSKNKVYLLERLENFGTIETKDVICHIESGDYSIEHIMPQTLTPAWMDALGEDYERIHSSWLHRIANLTLTGYNSRYSNSAFSEKRDMKNGFRDSGLRMNAYIASQAEWTEAQMEERSELLRQRALEIWALPSTDYKPAQRQLESAALDDDVSLTGRVLIGYAYRGVDQPADSWRTMYEQVVKMLHAEDKSILAKLAVTQDDSVELSAHVATSEVPFNASFEVDDHIFVNCGTSTHSKIVCLQRFFKLFDKDPSDLVFYLRTDKQQEEEIAGTRYETRLKFWAYALPIIQAAHDSCFSGCTGSKSNYVSGYMGLRGCSICCIANWDCVRVELFLRHPSQGFNKQVFDALLSDKESLSAKFDSKLVWDRNDSAKSSKIYVQMDGVSIENESDWPRMADFLAKYSRLVYDVFAPLLAEIVPNVH